MAKCSNSSEDECVPGPAPGPECHLPTPSGNGRNQLPKEAAPGGSHVGCVCTLLKRCHSQTQGQKRHPLEWGAAVVLKAGTLPRSPLDSWGPGGASGTPQELTKYSLARCGTPTHESTAQKF